MEQDRTQFAFKILCGDSIGCDEVDNYFATSRHNDGHFI